VNLIIFFVITQISYFSIVGYGNLIFREKFNDIWLNNFINFIIGIIFLNLLGFILYYLNINFNYINLIVLLVGLIFFNFSKNRKNLTKIILVNLLFFSGILISKLHEDWSYHFSFIEQISAHKPIIGIGNVDDIHILSSSFFSFVQKIFYLPYYEFKLILIPIYLIYLNLLYFLLNILFNERKKILILFFLIFVIIAGKFSRLSEFGFDYISNFILIKILILYLFQISKSKYKFNFESLYILFFLYAVTIKVISVFFLPLLIYFVYKELNIKKILNKTNFISVIVLFCFIIDSFLRSGCLLYFFDFTCFSSEIVSWSIDHSRVYDHKNHIELWAKGFYTQNNILNPNIYLDNWFVNWFEVHFVTKILSFVFIPIIFLILIILKDNIYIKEKNLLMLLFFSFFSLLLWFFFLPQFRFGVAIILSFSISIIILFLKFKETIKLKKIYYLVLIFSVISIYNLKNFIRINEEFKRSDNHKFVNFPFPPEKRIKKTKKFDNSSKYLIINDKKLIEFRLYKIIN
tara:strand:+ start:5569 stop:7122 length:1554 start_codon:yes stop_codon:yes gene_type:complete